MMLAYVQEKRFGVVTDTATKNPYDHAQPEMKDRISHPTARDSKATVTAVLLVDMTVSCLLRAVLQNDHHGQ